MGLRTFRHDLPRAVGRMAVLAALVLAACDGGPAAPDLDPGSSPEVSAPPSVSAIPAVGATAASANLVGELTDELAALLDGSFTFRPPLPEVATVNAFDATLLAAVEVEVCEVGSCGTSPIVVYTSATGQGSEVVRMDEVTEHFIVNWDTDAFALDMSAAHRVRVLALGLELGSFDVVLVNNGSEAKDAATGSTIALKDGRVLPVKFTVTRNRLVTAWVLAAQGGTASEVASLLDSEFGSTPEEAAAILVFSGFSAADVAGALRESYGLSATDATDVLIGAGLVTDAASAARVLSDGGYDSTDVTEVLRDTYGQDATQAGATLFQAGFLAGDVGTALREAFGLDLQGAVTVLHDAGFGGGDVGAWIQTQPDAPEDVEGVAELLGQAGYGIEGVAGFLAASGIEGDEALASALLASGFATAQVADWLVDDQGRTEAAAAAVLQALGEAAADVGSWLLGRELSEAATVTALKEAGFSAGETGDWLLDVLDKTEEKAGMLLAGAGHAVEDVGDWLVGRFEAIGDNALGKATAVLKKTEYAFDKVGNWVLDKAGQVEAKAAAAFKFAGYTAHEAVDFFYGSLGRAADKIGGFLEGGGYEAVETAGALIEKANATVELVAAILDGIYGISAEQASGIFEEIGSAASEVGEALVSVFEQTVEDAAALLGQAGFAVGDAADWIFDSLEAAGQDPLETTARVLQESYDELQAELKWLSDKARDLHQTQADILANLTGAYKAGGYEADEAGPFLQAEFTLPAVDVGEYLAGAGYVVDEVASALTAMGASAVEIAEALVTGFGESLESVAAILKANGFDAVAAFDAVYEVSRRVLNNPMEFSLSVALAAMNGVGYFWDDLKHHLVDGIHEWTAEVLLAEGLIPSGFSLAELAEFAVDVAGLTVQRVLEIMESKGVPVEDVLEGLVASSSATMDEIVEHAVAAYNLTGEAFAAAMYNLGVKADLYADKLVTILGLTEAKVTGILRTAGYAADRVGDWLLTRYEGVADRLERVAGFLSGAGYVFDDVADWVWNASGKALDKTIGVLRFVQYSADRVVRFVTAVSDAGSRIVFSELQKAGYGASEAADAIHTEADASFVDIGGWLSEFYELGLEETLDILHGLGAGLVDLLTVLADVYQGSLETATTLVVKYNYTVTEIIANFVG